MPGGVVGEQAQRRILLDVLGEHEHAGGGSSERMTGPRAGLRRCWPGGMRMSVTTTSGRCWRPRSGAPRRRRPRRRRRGRGLEDAHDPGAEQERSPRPPRPATGCRRSRAGQLRPAAACRRRAGWRPRARRRAPPRGPRARAGPSRPLASAPPTPSSLTSTPAARRRALDADRRGAACAYLATLASASATTKYAAVSTAAGSRSPGAATSSTGTGARAASERIAGSRPRSESIGGMDAAGELAQLVEARRELVDDGVDDAARVGEPSSAAAREPQVQRQRHEPLTARRRAGPAPAAGVRVAGLHDPRPRLPQLVDGARSAASSRPLQQEGGRCAPAARTARVLVQPAVVDDRRDALAVALDFGERAAGVGRRRERPGAPASST